KEVADRMRAKAGTKEYGSLSVAVQYYAEVSRTAVISPNSFFPPPKVSSAVVLLKGRISPKEHFGVIDVALFFQVVRASFGQRRKILLNALSAGVPNVTKETVGEILNGVGISPTARGETLSIEQFVKIANALTLLRDRPNV
ncbi:MAG: rRNA adenine dimethyltransferase family protein, partial [bacterium]|nr:rRNA adenine dimethyltransferase family protein [bacterium]